MSTLFISIQLSLLLITICDEKSSENATGTSFESVNDENDSVLHHTIKEISIRNGSKRPDSFLTGC